MMAQMIEKPCCDFPSRFKAFVENVRREMDIKRGTSGIMQVVCFQLMWKMAHSGQTIEYGSPWASRRNLRLKRRENFRL